MPLLLVAGLWGSSDGNDTLEGTGTETISVRADDHLLTFGEDAVGWAGEGDDTIVGSGNSFGYGRAGDDALFITDEAQGWGGDGYDMVDAAGASDGFGGAGNDRVLVSENPTGHGNAGNATLVTSKEGSVHGGLGADALRLIDGDPDAGGALGGAGNDALTIRNDRCFDAGAGNDRIMTAGFAAGAGGDGADLFITDVAFDGEAGLKISDFDASEDQLSILLADRNLDDIMIASRFDETLNATVVELTEGEIGGFSSSILRGVQNFDLNDIVLYGDDLLWGSDGDDTVSRHNALRVDLGAGDDALVVSTTGANDDCDTGIAPLGAGVDRVVIAPTTVDTVTQSLTDFDPSEDFLGVVVPQPDASGLSMTSSQNASSNTTVLTFNSGSGGPGAECTIELRGIDAAITPDIIAHHATDAAAFAGTSCATL